MIQKLVQDVETRIAPFFISTDQLISQQPNKSIIQSPKPPIKKFTHTSNRSVTESVNNLSQEWSTHLITSSPHHLFVQTAFCIIAWSLKYQITISHNNPLTNLQTLQIYSEPNRIVTHAIDILLTHLRIYPFV